MIEKGREVPHFHRRVEQRIGNETRTFAVGPGGLPVSEAKAGVVIALPMHPYMDEATQIRVIDAVNGFNG